MAAPLFYINLVTALSPLVGLCFIFSVLAQSSKKNKVRFYEVPFKLNPKLGLAEQWPLKFWLCIIIVYFFHSGLLYWKGYELDLSAEGLSVFFSISKIPLSILSLVIPAGLFISRLHSTTQTAVQINETEKKNNMDSFYNQRKYYVEYLNSLGEVRVSHETKIQISVSQALYTSLFTSASTLNGASGPNTSKMHDLLFELLAGVLLLQKLAYRKASGNHIYDANADFLNLIHCTNKICDELSIKDSVISQLNSVAKLKFKIKIDNEYFTFSRTSIGKSFDHFLAAIKFSEIILLKTLEDHQTFDSNDFNEPTRTRLLSKEIRENIDKLSFNRDADFYDEISRCCGTELIGLPPNMNISGLVKTSELRCYS